MVPRAGGMVGGHARTRLEPVFGDIASGERQTPCHNGVGVFGVSISEWTKSVSSSKTIP